MGPNTNQNIINSKFISTVWQYSLMIRQNHWPPHSDGQIIPVLQAADDKADTIDSPGESYQN